MSMSTADVDDVDDVDDVNDVNDVDDDTDHEDHSDVESALACFGNIYAQRAIRQIESSRPRVLEHLTYGPHHRRRRRRRHREKQRCQFTTTKINDTVQRTNVHTQLTLHTLTNNPIIKTLFF